MIYLFGVLVIAFVVVHYFATKEQAKYDAKLKAQREAEAAARKKEMEELYADVTY